MTLNTQDEQLRGAEERGLSASRVFDRKQPIFDRTKPVASFDGRAAEPATRSTPLQTLTPERAAALRTASLPQVEEPRPQPAPKPQQKKFNKPNPGPQVNSYLSRKVQSGERVRVTMQSGRVFEGKVFEVSPYSLRVGTKSNKTLLMMNAIESVATIKEPVEPKPELPAPDHAPQWVRAVEEASNA